MGEMTLSLAAGLVLVGEVLDWDEFCATVMRMTPSGYEEHGRAVIAAVERLLADARGVAAG